jgi:hypothetical protein
MKRRSRVAIVVFSAVIIGCLLVQKVPRTLPNSSGAEVVDFLGRARARDYEVSRTTTSGAAGRVLGRALAGKKTRHYSQDMLFRSFAAKPTKSQELEPWCEKWGVVTSTFDVTEAVRRQVHVAFNV